MCTIPVMADQRERTYLLNHELKFNLHDIIFYAASSKWMEDRRTGGCAVVIYMDIFFSFLPHSF